MRTIAAAMTICLCLALAACGSSTGDRTVSGAGIGATAGAVVGAVTGLSVLHGVLIGATAGGLTGAFTSEDTINLGDPIWASDAGAPNRSANRSAVSRVQASLAKLGYDPGPIDGVMGRRTRFAIEDYQEDNDLLVDGRATLKLARHIEGRMERRS